MKHKLQIHDLNRIKIGLNLAVNAYAAAFKQYGKKIPKKVKREIKEMTEAGMIEAEKLGLT